MQNKIDSNARTLRNPSSTTLVLGGVTLLEGLAAIVFTPKMLDFIARVGVEASGAIRIVSEWYWVGCAVGMAVALLAVGWVLAKIMTDRQVDFRPWLLVSAAAVTWTTIWSVFIFVVLYTPLMQLSDPI